MKLTGAKKSRFGTIVAAIYPKLPLRNRFLTLACKLEGGDLYSTTLRTVLRQYYGVEVGYYSYGSLLKPGYADQQTRIGAYVSIGPNVRRFGAAHPIDSPSMHPFWYNPRLGYATEQDDVKRLSCNIGHDVWIGANVTILPGCQSIGIGAIIGAGSVVTKNVEPFTIVAGNPAKEIGTRLNQDARNQLLEEKPWNKEPVEMQRIIRRIQRSNFTDH
ncbi:antibiotic acetyltransferase [Rhodococcus sp. SJ-2]